MIPNLSNSGSAVSEISVQLDKHTDKQKEILLLLCKACVLMQIIIMHICNVWYAELYAHLECDDMAFLYESSQINYALSRNKNE